MSEKPSNPKDAIGVMKVPLHLVSPISKALQAVAHYLGNAKYGAWNWRAGGARYSVYLAAMNRHMDRFTEGEEYDTDGTPHLANALACLNIIVEAYYIGKLIDDRPPSNHEVLVDLYKKIENEMMPKILAAYGDRKPRHWTINDTQECKSV